MQGVLQAKESCLHFSGSHAAFIVHPSKRKSFAQFGLNMSHTHNKDYEALSYYHRSQSYASHIDFFFADASLFSRYLTLGTSSARRKTKASDSSINVKTVNDARSAIAGDGN